jgi:hypothetical protein
MKKMSTIVNKNGLELTLQLRKEELERGRINIMDKIKSISNNEGIYPNILNPYVAFNESYKLFEQMEAEYLKRLQLSYSEDTIQLQGIDEPESIDYIIDKLTDNELVYPKYLPVDDRYKTVCELYQKLKEKHFNECQIIKNDIENEIREINEFFEWKQQNIKKQVFNKISRSDYEKLQEWLDNIEPMNTDELIAFLNELRSKYDWCIHAELGKYDICNDEYQHSIDFTLQCKKENEYKYIDELYFATVYCDGSGAEDLAEMYSDVPLTTTFGDGFGDCFFQFRFCDYKYFLRQLIKHLENFVEDGKN